MGVPETRAKDRQQFGEQEDITNTIAALIGGGEFSPDRGVAGSPTDRVRRAQLTNLRTFLQPHQQQTRGNRGGGADLQLGGQRLGQIVQTLLAIRQGVDPQTLPFAPDANLFGTTLSEFRTSAKQQGQNRVSVPSSSIFSNTSFNNALKQFGVPNAPTGGQPLPSPSIQQPQGPDLSGNPTSATPTLPQLTAVPNTLAQSVTPGGQGVTGSAAGQFRARLNEPLGGGINQTPLNSFNNQQNRRQSGFFAGRALRF